MVSADLPSFDLRLVPSFVTVAEERNFGRAAERLRIAQPALSRQIAKLEEQLGAPLLVRGPREATLTVAGETFLRACREITESAGRAQASVQTDPGGRAEGARTGLVAHVGLGLNSDLTRTLAGFSDAHPDLRLDIDDGSRSSGVEALLAGEADVAFEVVDGVPPELAYLPIHRLRVGVACARNHPLAASERTAWADLEGETVFMAPRGPGRGYNAFLRAHLRMFGVTVEEAEHDATEALDLAVAIGSGRGVSIGPAFPLAPAAGTVTWVLLTPLAEMELGLAWDPARSDEGVERFVGWAAATMSSVH